MYEHVPAWIYEHPSCPEKGVRSLGSGVTVSCESVCECFVKTSRARNCRMILQAPPIRRVCGGRVSSCFSNYRWPRELSLIQAAKGGIVLFVNPKGIAGEGRQAGSALPEIMPCNMIVMMLACL